MSNRFMKSLFLGSLRSKGIALTVISFMLFITVISLVFYEGTKKTVLLDANGEELEIKTHANTVGKLLSEQEIVVSENDIVTPPMNTPVEEGLSINWEQAKQVAILVDQEITSLWTTQSNIDEVLEEAGIEISEHDRVTPSLNEQLGVDQIITIEKAFQVVLNDGGEEQSFWSTSITVADFLKRENIQLNELDRLEAHIEELIMPNSVVNIVRVEKVTDVVEESANFATETRTDSSLLKGREKVVQAGENGTVSRKFEVLKENGTEVSRKMLEEKVIKKPQKKIVAIGSKIAVASANTNTKDNTSAAKSNVSVSRNNNSAPSGGKEFYVTATAYTAGCNGCSGITATGINLNANRNLKVIAVDPSVIPLGSKVWVEGYGHAIAGDTGGAIKGKKIDLHVPTKEAAYKFGRRQVKIKVLN
ncbi:G5 and 3D domain-containing protein [Sporosarcina sp. G11-34]|uniref:G5 and 3D domain-containing protein n=1 Tax=Sporosarcina sp. G11-34 TaxID=2849605 RepID=UPI0022A8FC81|nr:G5 and 3D domain-containing protein [Sporosarcina sp. G11-34]MCZ2260561.1 DUF348 domain-containing protein [Sporosarcina sp. G11-34]